MNKSNSEVMILIFASVSDIKETWLVVKLVKLLLYCCYIVIVVKLWNFIVVDLYCHVVAYVLGMWHI